jgi:hypothetical protein
MSRHAARRPLTAALALCAAALSPVAAGAEPQDAAPPGEGAAADAGRSARTGAFLPFTMSARSDTQRALVSMQGGYDTARAGPVFQSVVEAQVAGPLSLRAGGSYLGPSGQLRPDVGAKLDLLRQGRHGVDLAFAAGYEAQGFNLTPAIAARVALARTSGATTLLGNLGYGVGTEQGEHHGDARLAALRRVGRNLHLGLDSRFRVDLERDQDEPAGEPDWELVAGPAASYALGRFVISASGGVSVLQLRLQDDRHLGVLGTMGLGAVF